MSQLAISATNISFLYLNRDGDKMAPSVEKKIAELEMGLLHLQQNIDIPEITLPVHPLVAAVIKRLVYKWFLDKELFNKLHPAYWYLIKNS